MSRISCTLIACASMVLSAQDYRTGIRQLQAGNYATAEQTLRDALQLTQKPLEQARLHKWIGITQYMQGERTDAEHSFQQALRLDSATRIYTTEVEDPTVVDFFAEIQSRTRSPQSPGTHPSATASATLTVDSAAHLGRVFLGQTLLGPTATLLHLPPGRHIITVQSMLTGARIVKRIELKPGQHTLTKVTFPEGGQRPPSTKSTSSKPPPGHPAPPAREQRSEKTFTPPKPQTSRPATRQAPARKVAMAYGAADLLPLGFPQWRRGEIPWAMTYGAIQVCGLGLGTYLWLRGDHIVSSADEEVRRRDEARPNLPPESQLEDFYAMARYRAQELEHANNIYDTATLIYGVSILAWAASALHAANSASESESLAGREPPPAETMRWNLVAVPGRIGLTAQLLF